MAHNRQFVPPPAPMLPSQYEPHRQYPTLPPDGFAFHSQAAVLGRSDPTASAQRQRTPLHHPQDRVVRQTPPIPPNPYLQSSPSSSVSSLHSSSQPIHLRAAQKVPRSLPPRQVLQQVPRQYAAGEQSAPSQQQQDYQCSAQVPSAVKSNTQKAHYSEVTCSKKGVDLNSASECRTAKFTFLDPPTSSITAYRCTYPLLTCLTIKQWLLARFAQPDLSAPGILRMEGQDLHLLKPKTAGVLLLLSQACFLDGNPGLPVNIIALLLPHDDRIRLFYTLLPVAGLMRCLIHDLGVLVSPKQYPSFSTKHKQLCTLVRAEFEKSVNVPNHPHYLSAQQITDYSPGIISPETALKRLEQNYVFISSLHKPARDLEDDRYLLSLHPAERSIASSVHLSCAEYLLLKRQYFRAFHRELVRSQEQIGVGRRRIRAENAHVDWLREAYQWKENRARRLVVGWKEMGFLDERRVIGEDVGGRETSEGAEDEEMGERVSDGGSE